MASRIIPNGTQVTIINKDSIHYKDWGIVRHFDGDRYHVGMFGSEKDTPIFDRDELRVKRN